MAGADAVIPFDATGLQLLDDLLFSQASAVVPMRDVHAGNHDPGVIGLRHDVDDNRDSFVTAIRLAEWEAERGYRSTYFLLHSAGYWGPEMLEAAHRMEELGHEIGIHANALAEALRGRGNPEAILHQALSTLRSDGLSVTGAVAHGDELCGAARFVNDEMFQECRRRDYGAAERELRHEGRTVRIVPLPLSAFQLEYDSNWLPRGDYLSDSGGRWSQRVSDLHGRGQLHVLVHPDWWSQAFASEAVAA